MTRPQEPHETLLDVLQRKRDGRNVDPSMGVLSGEGAQQRVKTLERAPGVQPSGDGALLPPGAPSYYGLPAIKEPVWIASVPTYLYVGGVAGATSVLGFAAELIGGAWLRGLARRCVWVGMAGDMLSAGLLIHDLGRPERFLHMLRVFRPTSPMSIGSWVLAASGAFNTLALLVGHRGGWPGTVGRAAGAGAALLGLPLSGYTAVLLTNTAVPLWQSMHRSLPLFFMASATAASGSLLSLLPHPRHEAPVLRAFRVAGKVAEVATRIAVERDAARVPEVARPLREGLPGALWTASKVCAGAGLLLELLPRRTSGVATAANVLTSVSAVAARFAIFHAGKVSSRNPQATFQGQRQGLGAAEVTGHTVASDGKPLKFPLPVVR
ncbi:NrfD/PsrC family molybdoenzyme membrane anchor subunit [Comamonas sp. JC664]|uniref:NrfD/PsrC family molybdoenzyme membrane anchor subunit n=1 Tax=Comamonas sp. JC664 TaxID=2801917 RepID=UPI00174920BB|nr:NrfD/PsrC family molybdoenzyme membrane anchor subunit [Comamonas sp. JC664]MBL0694426.1 polysulfide reductase NrfD [Comamonas sp. JC664]GHG77547.1 polysulfide reductase [Comamonas sp. KCTC 72670]